MNEETKKVIRSVLGREFWYIWGDAIREGSCQTIKYCPLSTRSQCWVTIERSGGGGNEEVPLVDCFETYTGAVNEYASRTQKHIRELKTSGLYRET